MVYNSYDPTEYGWAERDAVDVQINYVYDQLVKFQLQQREIDTHISNINFEAFFQEQEWAKEDEAQFLLDVARAEQQVADYNLELSEIELQIGGSYTLTG